MICSFIPLLCFELIYNFSFYTTISVDDDLIFFVKVCIAARSVGKLEELKKEMEEEGASCAVVKCDVVSGEDVKKMVHECEKQLGTCDILVNNAGKKLSSLFL